MRARAIVGFALLVACAREPETKPLFELRDVVAPEAAAAETRVPPAKPLPPPASDDTRELVLGLAASLTTSDAMLRNAVIDDLRALGDGAVPVLLETLTDPKRARAEREGAVEALAILDTAAAVDALVHEVESSREPWLRALCASRLTRTQHDAVLPRILARLKYEVDGETVIGIAVTLARHGNFAGADGLRVLRDTAADPAQRDRAGATLEDLARSVDAPNGDALVREWLDGSLEARQKSPDPSDRLRVEVWKQIGGLAAWDLRGVDDRRFALSHMNAWVVPLLALTLHDQNVYVRTHAAQCLERMGPRAAAAVPELIAALLDPRLAPAAAAALGSIASRDATDALIAALDAKRDPELRVAAARALGSIGDAAALEPLRSMFDPRETLDIRQAAAEGLVRLGAGDAVARFLMECMASPLADGGTAERSLARWLERKSEADAAQFGEAWTRWRALDPADPQAIETVEAIAERRRARAAILDPLVAAAPQ